MTDLFGRLVQKLFDEGSHKKVSSDRFGVES